ncbi:MAG TPA: DNA mismatch repair endonuclease MutL [Thermoplasmata archaeon]|nr:DNA mismatch repair endonuclease MutL [Thermoplasmata archaeon]
MSGTESAPRRPIRRLSAETVERIAAGEVVERPASIAKELVENAVDAGATSIVVRLVGGGIDRIEVADDGAGIVPEELGLAVERHATSKLAPDGPVETIEALGFRGEALAAIGAVARLRLVSRPPERESGEGISVVGGAVGGRFPAARAPGTTVEVEQLFFNTPARKKFLRSAPSEQVELVRTVERAYLARPTVGVRIESEGRELAAYPPTSRLSDAAAHVLGAAFLDASFPLRGELPGGRLAGSLGLPSVAASTSGQLFLAANGRAVLSRPIAQAVRAAFGESLPRGRFPTGVIHLEIDPRALDVNVHPTKREIRFARERELTDAIRRRVRECLLAAPGGGEAAPAARSPSWSGRADDRPILPPVARERTTHPTAQQTLGSVARAEPAASASSAVPAPPGTFRLLGVVDLLYWVAATDDGFTLIDQHAASERLLYESILRDGALGRQQLVEPVTVRLTSAERAAWAAHSETVRAAGFELDAFGPQAVRVRSVPAYRGRSPRYEAIHDLLTELAEGGRPTLPDGLEQRTAASIACHAAIRAGDEVAPAEILRVLESLDALPERVRTCPHGRPIFVRLPRSRLDGWFLRRGP